MSDRLREFLADARWGDPYWWADHQLLQAALCALTLGMIGLAFKYAELTLEAKLGATANVPAA